MRMAVWLLGLLMVRPAFAVEPPVTAVEFLPAGKSVVVGSQAGLVLRSWPELKQIGKYDSELLNVHDLAVSPNGKLFAAVGGEPGEQGVLELFKTSDRELTCRKALHDDSIYSVAWHPDSTRLATAGLDRKVQIFDVPSQNTRQPPQAGPRFGITSAIDGQCIANGCIGRRRPQRASVAADQRPRPDGPLRPPECSTFGSSLDG